MICTACHTDKSDADFRRHHDGSRMGYCTACHLAKRRAQHAAAKAHRNALVRLNYAANLNGMRDKYAARRAAKYAQTGRAHLAAWEAMNPDRAAAAMRAKMARYAAALTDSYVRRLMVQHGSAIRAAEIPQVLIEAKRLQIMIERAVNEQRA